MIVAGVYVVDDNDPIIIGVIGDVSFGSVLVDVAVDIGDVLLLVS